MKLEIKHMIHKNLLVIFLFTFVSQIAFSKNVYLPDFTQLVEKTANTVVNISARQNAEESLGNRQSRRENPLERFFGIPQNPQDSLQRDSVSGGSGFIISEDGYILTNRHVVHGADEIIVRLSDRREFDAELIGEDEASDIALLKVNAKKLPKLDIGDVDTIKIGEWVMAIGSPLSFEQTVTKGIISAKGRPLGGQQYIPYLQSDVPINRGNSGGPLINMDGKVIGVNTLILSNTGGYMGLSFSVPIDVAMSVANQLKSGGTVKRGLLGVNIQLVTQEMADYLGLDKPQGALVTNVNKDSAAEKAGIKVQDVIIKFDGKNVDTSRSLPPLVGAVKPGTKVDVTLIRDGDLKIIKAVLGGLPTDDLEPVSTKSKNLELELGFEISNLNDEQKDQLEIKYGVLVKDITKRSVLRSGLRTGAVILEMGKTQVKSVKHFKKMLEELEDEEPIVLLVMQGGGNSYIVIERD
jgi:serine protease Do